MTAQLTKIKEKNPRQSSAGDEPRAGTRDQGHEETRDHRAADPEPRRSEQGSTLELAGRGRRWRAAPGGRLIVWQSVPDTNPQKAVLKEFAEAYKAKYNADANTFAGHAYDSLHIVVDAIKAANSTDSAKIRDEIEKTKGFVGDRGRVHLHRHGPQRSDQGRLRVGRGVQGRLEVGRVGGGHALGVILRSKATKDLQRRDSSRPADAQNDRGSCGRSE